MGDYPQEWYDVVYAAALRKGYTAEEAEAFARKLDTLTEVEAAVVVLDAYDTLGGTND